MKTEEKTPERKSADAVSKVGVLHNLEPLSAIIYTLAKEIMRVAELLRWQ